MCAKLSHIVCQCHGVSVMCVRVCLCSIQRRNPISVVGVALVLSQTLMRRLSWEPLNLIRVGAVIAAVGFAATALAASDWALWVCFGIAAAGTPCPRLGRAPRAWCPREP